MDDPDLSHAKSTVCTHCSKTFSSKRRLDGHIKSKHSQEDQTYGRKHECYSTVFNQDAKSKVFSCNICKKHLSSKQRIEDHLYKRHGKSPVTKIYKRWKSDPSAAVPKTTRMRRHQLFSIPDETDTTLDSNDVFEGESGNGDGVESGVENTVGDLAEFSSESENVIQSDISSENGSISVCNLSDSDSETDYSDSTNSSDNFTLTETASKEMLTYAEAHAYCKVAYGIRHNLSGDASADLTKLMEICSNTSISKFDVTNDRPDYKRVHYCTLCNSLFPTDLEEVICPTDGCHSLRYQGGILSQSLPNRRPMASFILADVQTQLKHVLQRKGMWESIQKTKEHTRRPKTSICDIVDGDCYRNFCRPGQFLDNTNNLSAVFNTDGIPLYNSSKVKLWPIFLAVNEIPVSRRFARENLLLAGIWQGKGNPPFIHYMYAFGEQMNSLYEDGLTIQVAETFVKVKVAVICSTMDLQAKAYVLNMTMHNGEFGCSTCEESGIVVRQGKGHTRCYPYRSLEEKAPLRQSNDIKQNKAHVATLTKKKQMGICGFTGLSVMSCFDLVDGILPDYMHGVLLGITKTLLKLWFSRINANKLFFIGDHLHEISSRLQNIRPPDYIERLPRDLAKHYLNFKATELQSWLLFYAIPCLDGILHVDYFKHLCLLSEGVYILLSDHITASDIENAEQLLDDFYEQFEEFYGRGSCGLNVHNTGRHLASFVRQWGPAWGWSCFPFEDANAAILQAVHGTGDICAQYLAFKHLEGIVSNLDLSRCPSPEIKQFLGCMRKHDKVWSSSKPMNNCLIAGATRTFTQEEAGDEILTKTGAGQCSELLKVFRVVINGQKLYSEQYGRMKRRNCHTVCTKHGQLLRIMYFIVNKLTKYVYAVGKEILLAEECLVNERCLHVVKVRHSNVTVVVDVSMISEKVFQIVVDNNTFICRMPNILGHSILK